MNVIVGPYPNQPFHPRNINITGRSLKSRFRKKLTCKDTVRFPKNDYTLLFRYIRIQPFMSTYPKAIRTIKRKRRYPNKTILINRVQSFRETVINI